MLNDDNASDGVYQSDSQSASDRAARSSIFSVPSPIKWLFNSVPLITYGANELPLRVPRRNDQNALYIFTTQHGATRGDPSFNPSCLRWQAYLKFCHIEHTTVVSNNHASPSGALPFLLPSVAKGTDRAVPVPSSKLQRWVAQNTANVVDEAYDLRYDAYLSLIDHRIRRAWLYTLYLTSNFHTIVVPLYVDPSSTNPLVRMAIAHELRSAAETELLKHSVVIDAELIYQQAEEALIALESVLGNSEWFFGARAPRLFDAAIFAYTHLLLDEKLGNGWAEVRMSRIVRKHGRLVHHRNAILDMYF
ncbi:hypothetical protein M501DRAFT_936244 [Patellaria atrata CBS 101060]|uniref:Mitochondrial outer membrane protein n=1 Tax=Patellaria atrata CBS 101060 TaxID=1346257 RepID=A0A9P4S8S2_9PEZI|nr:hypothetical protein M501DRAFT_936244 [Patellaria atrata CBS 101060]